MSNHQKLLKKYSILFAEDDATMREATADILRVFFREVIVARDGKEALERYEDEKPDMILSDIKMPLMDGFSLIASIRQNDFTTPIVLLTSYCDQTTLFEAANASIDGYITKPIVLESMLEALLKVVPKIAPKKELVSFGEGVLYNTLSEELYKNGCVVPLGEKEQKMLKLFLAHKEAVVHKDDIIASLWGVEDVTDSALKGVLNRLRTKLGSNAIVCVKGSGWRLHISA
jgi:DNA-binding response OmpR family regulator